MRTPKSPQLLRPKFFVTSPADPVLASSLWLGAERHQRTVVTNVLVLAPKGSWRASSAFPRWTCLSTVRPQALSGPEALCRHGSVQHHDRIRGWPSAAPDYLTVPPHCFLPAGPGHAGAGGVLAGNWPVHDPHHSRLCRTDRAAGEVSLSRTVLIINPSGWSSWWGWPCSGVGIRRSASAV